MKKQLLINGKLYLERGKFAEALYLEDGVIREVGTTEGLRGAHPDAELLDCQGHTVLPGLNDSHQHTMLTGRHVSKMVNIKDCRSIEDIVQRCRTFMAENPELTRRGLYAPNSWNQEFFDTDRRIPDRHDLDRISTEIPVVLERTCGHIVSANTKAVEMAGFTKDSPPVEGGTFEKDADGVPNGIFTENAAKPIRATVVRNDPEELEALMLRAMEYAVAHGLTSVQSNDIGVSVTGDYQVGFDLIRRIFEEGKALCRYHYQINFLTVEEFQKFLDGEWTHGKYPAADGWLTMGCLKMYKDGTLGGRTAMMRQGYADAPDVYGEEALSDESMRAFLKLADQYGMQAITHVIGDKAIEDTVKCYEEILHDGKNPHRNALVHCQITDRPLLERIVKDDLSVFFQPVFLEHDLHIVEDRVGKELASTSYAFKTLHDLGGHESYGSDSPVEDCNPFPCIYNAMTRQDLQGRPDGGYAPHERVDLETAIDAYTVGSAYNQFQENVKGRLKPGYYADLVILDRDIFTCPVEEIPAIRPLLTMVGGKVVYRQEGF